MVDLAQTNVQLIRQVVDADWSDDELVRLRRAYELVMWACSGLYRTNGKTQIAHDVGVSSALATVGERPALVTAGLVHSLYLLGEFGSGRRGPHPEKRARVRDTLGPEVEQLVYAYTELDWNRAAVGRLTASAAEATPLERDVVALRVANAADEFADLAMRLSAPHPTSELVDGEAVDAMVALARAFDLGALGALLADQYRRGTVAPIPAVLFGAVDNTVFVPPASYGRRVHVALQDSRVGHRITESYPVARRVGVWLRRRIG
jgi:hypothetical protein